MSTSPNLEVVTHFRSNSYCVEFSSQKSSGGTFPNDLLVSGSEVECFGAKWKFQMGIKHGMTSNAELTVVLTASLVQSSFCGGQPTFRAEIQLREGRNSWVHCGGGVLRDFYGIYGTEKVCSFRNEWCKRSTNGDEERLTSNDLHKMLITGGKLCFLVEIFCDSTTQFTSRSLYNSSSLPNTPSDSYNTLREDLTTLLHDKELSDVTILTTDQDVTFHVHKFILTMRSPVFKAMLCSDMTESTKNEITITDFSSDVIQCMVAFLYTDFCTADGLEKHAFELFMLAHKYEVGGLLSVCERYMVLNLAVRNVVDRFNLAELYNASFLRKHCIIFMARNMRALSTDDSLLFDRVSHDVLKEINKTMTSTAVA